MVSRRRSFIAVALVVLCLSIGFAPEAMAAPRDGDHDTLRDRIVRVIKQIRNLIPGTNDEAGTPPKP